MTGDATMDATRETCPLTFPVVLGQPPAGEHRQPLVDHHPLGRVVSPQFRHHRGSPWSPSPDYSRNTAAAPWGRRPCRVAAKKPMVKRRKPIVTELALADVLDQLVNLIEELRIDVNPRGDHHRWTESVKLIFSGTPDMGFPVAAGSPRHPGAVVAASGTRASATETPYRSGRNLRRSARDMPGCTLQASAAGRNT